MSGRVPVVRVALASCIAIALSGCGGGDGAAPAAPPPPAPTPAPPPSTPAPAPPPTVIALEVSGIAVLTSIGETTQFMVTATLSDGSMQAVEATEAGWESSDPAVATVSDGLMTAVGWGNATLTATYEGQSAEIPISVRISARTGGTVRVLYVSPADRQFRADYSEAITHALVDLQSWYRRQTGGLTFELFEATPEWCRMPGDHDYYSEGDSWNKIVEDVQHCAPVGHFGEEHIWVLYADVREECDKPFPVGRTLGKGGSGLTILHKEDLEGLNALGSRTVTTVGCHGTFVETPERWIGGAGHELGHALGLHHPPGYDDELPSADWEALMGSGFTTYPDTYLRFDEKEALLRSPFIKAEETPTKGAGATRLPSRVQGTVLSPSGVPIEGIRVSLLTDGFWNWVETARDGSFEIGVSEDTPGPFALSVHAGTTADCTWLGYYGSDGLTSLRHRASAVSADQAGVEIRLPSTPHELCGRDRVLTGTVFGPDGRPVTETEMWIGAYCCFWPLGRDGTFEIWPWIGALAAEIVRIRVGACGDEDVGYYGLGGWTDRREDALFVDVGAVGSAIEINLPANPGELCRP